MSPSRLSRRPLSPPSPWPASDSDHSGPGRQPVRAHLINASTEPVLAATPGAPLSFADIFEKVSPAVVSIKVTSKVDVSAMRRQTIPGFENFPFDIVPRGGGDQGDEKPDPRKAPKQMSSGSGFFISSDGFIVTNNHVVENAEDIKVVLNNGKELKAHVLVGRDEGTDLAVIRVVGHDFPYVSFENKAKPRVGDWVLAVGNPYDLGGTATAGIVSAYNRDIGEKFVDYIQIDAPINRGNSGGPTFDTYGRVIGVNTAIFSPSGGSVGIGFDIPADVAENVTKQLMGGHKITRGYIGATIQDLNDEMATSFGLTGRKGAVVANLVPGGPAATAGVQPGDIVVGVNGVAIEERQRADTRSGQGPRRRRHPSRCLPRRQGADASTVRSGLRPSEEQLALRTAASPNGDDEDSASRRRAEPSRRVRASSACRCRPSIRPSRAQYSIASGVHGLLVRDVKSSSDAGDKGLKRGDVIVRAGDRDVASTSDISAALGDWKKAGRTSIPLAVNRGGVTLFVPIKIEG